MRHRGDARGNRGAPLHDQVHLPTYLEAEDDLFYLSPRSQGDVSALETIPPSLPRDVLPEGPSRWMTSCYTIRSEHLKTEIQHFGSPTPTMDALASAANHQFPRCWTEMDSAWQRSLS